MHQQHTKRNYLGLLCKKHTCNFIQNYKKRTRKMFKMKKIVTWLEDQKPNTKNNAKSRRQLATCQFSRVVASQLVKSTKKASLHNNTPEHTLELICKHRKIQFAQMLNVTTVTTHYFMCLVLLLDSFSMFHFNYIANLHVQQCKCARHALLLFPF